MGPGTFTSRPADRAPRRAEDLHICAECGSELVHPVDWAPASSRQWRVDLRCPECEWIGVGIYTQAVVDRFDEVLDLGTEALLNDLTLLARANMEEEVERFITALDGGHIVPSDF
jgi:hypothetical protein